MSLTKSSSKLAEKCYCIERTNTFLPDRGICNECKFHVSVSNLPQRFCKEQLYYLFSAIGGICGCRMILDFQTNHYNVYGFVSFDCYYQAQEAVITRDGCVVEGRRIMVEMV